MNLPAEIKVDPFYTGFINLSFRYADQYKKNGKNFVTCFLKFGSVREACLQITRTYRKAGIELEGDFSGYADKQPLPDNWRSVLNDILKIIYTISK